MDRIPDEKSFNKFISQLETYYKKVSETVPLDELTETTGHAVIQYFMQKYPPILEGEINPILRVPKNGPLYDEVGYWIMRKDIHKRLKIEDSALLLDATMGWSSYNPDGFHEIKQLESAKEYLNSHGVQDFKDNFDIIERKFANLQQILLPCMSSGFVSKSSYEGYPEFFKQSSMHISSSKRFVYQELDI